MSNFTELLQVKGYIKRGDFTLKSGIKSNFYINLRTIVSDQMVMDSLLSLIKPLLSNKDESFALIGVPDGAIPIAVHIATTLKIKVLILPKAVKAHGDPIELKYYQNHKIILIEDVVSTGSSILETVERLQSYYANVVQVIAIVDRELGALQNIQAKYPDIKYQPLIRVHDIVVDK